MKKSLGQHFLRSERALAKIIEAGEIAATDTILEIGPGQGVLTEKLLAVSYQVLAVEKDDNLYEFLKQKFKKEVSSGKLILIHEDILEFDLSKLSAESYKLIANIPYNITGAILEKFLPAKNQPEKMVILVQKEVAERMVGNRGSKASTKESILSISVKAYGDPKYVETVKAGSFVPAPQVDSAIIAIENISKDFFNRGSKASTGGFLEKEFFRLLKTGFRSKRKKLSSNLSVIFDPPRLARLDSARLAEASRREAGKNRVKEAFQKLNLDENTRAEDVGIETWQNLAENLL